MPIWVASQKTARPDYSGDIRSVVRCCAGSFEVNQLPRARQPHTVAALPSGHSAY
jgi:hypothetical protein